MTGEPRVILIGGTSHTGKTTLARRLAGRPGWIHASTDSLARHPGRPWPFGGRDVRPHVVEHYGTLDTEQLVASVLAHYEAIWPLIETLVRRHAEDPAGPRLVLEGSALWPSRVADLAAPDVHAVWLVGEPGLLLARILAESRHAEADAAARRLIEAFVGRTVAFDLRLRAELGRLRLAGLDAGGATLEALLARR